MLTTRSQVVATDNQGAARPTLPPLSNQWQQRSPFPYAQQPYPVDALRSSSAPAGYQNASQAMQAPLAQSASLPGYAPAQGFAGYYSDPSAYYQNLAAMQAMQGMSGMAGMQAAFSNQGIMSGAGIAAANMTPSNFSTMTAAAQMLGMMGQGQAGVQGQGLQAPQGVQAQQNLQAQQSLQAQQLQLQNQQLQAQMAHLQSQQQAAQQQQQQQAQQAQQMLPGMPHQPPQQFTNIPQQGRPAVYAAGPPGLRQQPASVQQQQQYAQGAGDRRSPRAPAQQQAVQQYDNYNENEEDPLDAEIRRSYTCPFCGKGYTTSGHLARHRRTHLNINPFSCPVEGVLFLLPIKNISLLTNPL